MRIGRGRSSIIIGGKEFSSPTVYTKDSVTIAKEVQLHAGSVQGHPPSS